VTLVVLNRRTPDLRDAEDKHLSLLA